MEEKAMAYRTKPLLPEVWDLGKWWSSCSLGLVCRQPEPSRALKS